MDTVKIIVAIIKPIQWGSRKSALFHSSKRVAFIASRVSLAKTKNPSAVKFMSLGNAVFMFTGSFSKKEMAISTAAQPAIGAKTIKKSPNMGTLGRSYFKIG